MKRIVLEIVLFPFFILLSYLSRFKKKKFDIGIGPEPLINNVYHKKALELYGYSVETFVTDTYFITTDFDLNLKNSLSPRMQRFVNYITFFVMIFRYKCIYMYFNGGPLFGTKLLKGFEPFFLKIAQVKIVILPYGGDVSDTYTNKNLLFKYGLISHYPDYAKRKKSVQEQVDRWTKHAHYIFSGCDWVDYTYYWDQLMLAHFSIDTDLWAPAENEKKEGSFKILHAPNHRLIKGTEFLIAAVQRMKAEGLNIELTLLEKKPNSEVKKLMKEADLIVDQLVIGWYAMFALEGMSSGKPVVCFIREDLKKLYEYSGVLKDDLPLISATPDSIYECLRNLYDQRDSLGLIGKRSRVFVEKYHSLKVIGSFFDQANKKIGLR